MRVLAIVQAAPLARDRVVSGNSVRADGLTRGLVAHGIDVVHAYPEWLRAAAGRAALPDRVTVRTFATRDDLARLVHRSRCDAILVGFWELLDWLPSEPGVPVIADVLAPRVLEARYQPERGPTIETLRMLSAYRRADRFLCGNERQRHFLTPWLLLAGFACEPDAPIDVLPLAGAAARTRRRGRGPWQVVSGGVDWPWRRGESAQAAIERWVTRETADARVVRLTGSYVYENPASAAAGAARVRPGGRITRLPLVTYGAMERLFRSSHVGIELAERNLEREYSASFRAVEYLRAGVPVMLNDYLELAAHVDAAGAGWVVGAPRELAPLLRRIVRDPRGWERRSAAALRLARERFDPRRSVAPLVRFLRDPRRAERGPGLLPVPGGPA